MGLFNKLFGNKKNSELFTDDELTNAGVCPNCWGSQEYDNVVRELTVDKQIDINNHSSKHAFIQDFVVNQVEGIHLKKGDSGLTCTKCKINY